MTEISFCPYCGKQRADNATFCAGCGRQLVGAVPELAPAALVLSSRPVWPWAFIVVGLVLVVIFGAMAWVGSQTMQRTEQSTLGKVAPGLDYVGALLGVPGVGGAVDPRTGDSYIRSKQMVGAGVIVAIAGGLMALAGLIAFAAWRPRLVPPGPQAKRWGTWVAVSLLLIFLAFMALGVGVVAVAPSIGKALAKIDVSRAVGAPAYKYYGFRVGSSSTYRYTIEAKRGNMIEGSFRDAKDNNITFWIENPYGEKVYNPGIVSGTHKFSIKAQKTGPYVLVFGNERSAFSGRTMELLWRAY